MVDVLTRHVWLAEGTASEWAIFAWFSANINVGKMSFWTEVYQIWVRPIFKQTQVLWEFLSFKQMPREWQNQDEIRHRWQNHRATSLTPWDELRSFASFSHRFCICLDKDGSMVVFIHWPKDFGDKRGSLLLVAIIPVTPRGHDTLFQISYILYIASCNSR